MDRPLDPTLYTTTELREMVRDIAEELIQRKLALAKKAEELEKQLRAPDRPDWPGYE